MPRLSAKVPEDGVGDEGVEPPDVDIASQLDLDLAHAGPQLELGVEIQVPAFSEDHMLMVA